MGEPVLHGSRCTVCGTVGFPASARCARCATPTAEPLALSRTGVVWAYTVQRFAPKSPPYVPPATGFAPYAVGWVELPDGVRVEGIIDVPRDAGPRGAAPTGANNPAGAASIGADQSSGAAAPGDIRGSDRFARLDRAAVRLVAVDPVPRFTITEEGPE
ncbi:Zn-ribbon domain-containing OB-fold protein [Nocardia sp. NPDC057353]|uniref:Zn-ribbon domain-containing OB-fold protein n=1 Tax=Nocardia sp. NPDC057353 TaxID=3346104 RepID=UPI003639A3E3